MQKAYFKNRVCFANRSLIFTVSIVKAGLYFDGGVFRSYGLTIVLLGVIPCVCESLFASALLKYLLELPRLWALTLGFIWGGVSPVLLSLCLVSLANQGYGAKTGILSILLAAGTMDNTLVTAIFDLLTESLALTGEWRAARGPPRPAQSNDTRAAGRQAARPWGCWAGSP